jgi:hypothetical protein
MHQARERKDQKDRQTQQDVQLEDRAHVRDQRSGIGLEHDEMLGPTGQFQHLATLEVARGNEDR